MKQKIRKILHGINITFLICLLVLCNLTNEIYFATIMIPFASIGFVDVTIQVFWRERKK